MSTKKKTTEQAVRPGTREHAHARLDELFENAQKQLDTQVQEVRYYAAVRGEIPIPSLAHLYLLATDKTLQQMLPDTLDAPAGPGSPDLFGNNDEVER